MVARGDLGIEIDLEDVPIVQKKIISLCLKKGKPCIVATNLLESMIENPMPTRAEIIDVANSVYEKADAIMLSGETATGKYPIRTVKVMRRIAQNISKEVASEPFFIEPTHNLKKEITRTAVDIANNINIKAIVIFTRHGALAKDISKCRPRASIAAFTNILNTSRKMNLYWGVQPHFMHFAKNPEKTIMLAIEKLTQKKIVKKNDHVLVVSDILILEERVNAAVQVIKI